jgi:hypothetical protein
MASGDNVLTVLRAMPPTTLAAQPTALTGGSTPAENLVVWGFDAATNWYMDYLCQLHDYDGGGLTFSLPCSAASATSNDFIMGIGIRRYNASSEHLDSAQTYDFNDASPATAPGTVNEIVIPTVAFTDGADMDSWADTELAIVRVRRNAADGSDTMSGNANLWAITAIET